jgi:hypothetical protein
MDKSAEQYWKDHQLWRFIKYSDMFCKRSGEGYCINGNTIIGTVHYNDWKFSVVKNGTIKYVDPNGEKGYFIVN